MSNSTDEAARLVPPRSSHVYMSEIATANTNSAEIDTLAKTAQWWAFYSDKPFYIIFDVPGSVTDPNPATTATPASTAAATCWSCPGGSEHHFQLTSDARAFKWRTTAATQRLRYYAASPGGA